MVRSPFTLILLKRLSLSSKTPLNPHILSPSSIFTTIINSKHFSASPQPARTATQDPPKPTSLTARLSFVFDQIDQIEKQKQQLSLENDETLQRIRAWRQSKKESQAAQKQFQSKERNPDSGIAKNDASSSEPAFSDSPELAESQSFDALQRIRAWRESKHGESKEYPEAENTGNEAKSSFSSTESASELELAMQKGKDVEVVHPRPEWIELMERLVQQNYFDHIRREEDKMI